jgi:hypothetical protein
MLGGAPSEQVLQIRNRGIGSERGAWAGVFTANAPRQRLRIGLWLHAQLVRQNGATRVVGFQRLTPLTGSEVSAHFATIRDFIECIEGDPMRGGFSRAGKIATRELDFGQPVEDQAQASPPNFGLSGHPIVEGGRITERKPGEKIAAVTGSGGLQHGQAG